MILNVVSIDISIRMKSRCNVSIFLYFFNLLFCRMAELRVVPKKLSTDTLFTLELKMPNVLPQKDDEYFCTGFDLNEQEIYVKKFDPNADAGKIHHMIIFGCKSVIRSHLYPNHWPCSHTQFCPGMRIIYAWGRNAPSLQLPPDVGFHLGPQSDINYLVLQAHYAHPLSESDSSGVRLIYAVQPLPYVAGIFLLASNDGLIPANNPKTHVDINCRLNRDPITVFAYRVHAHTLGVVVTGYRFSPLKKQWDLIAKGNPQWPQAFYPMEQPMRIEPNDIIYARCTYNSISRTSLTVMGSRSSDEMCNLYLMYYADNPLFSKSSSASNAMGQFGDPSDSCEGMEFESHVLPEGNDVPPPRNLTMEESAIGQHSGHHHHGGGGPSEAASLMVSLKVHPEWPFGAGIFGQITAIDVDQDDNIVIFHRGKHVWNELSFDLENRYRPVRDGPIDEPTIVTIDSKSKKILDKWGQNLFFLPHGLTIDRKNKAIWLTDVALHQVFKYSIDPADSKNYRKSFLTLGQRFRPGKDEKHFCKPTSVALDYATGDFYVADGYCNSRVMRFDSVGKFLNHWGHEPIIAPGPSLDPTPNSLNVPHKVLLVERPDGQKLACIADRENGRVECFLVPFGQFKFQIKLSQFNGRVFSIAYSKRDDILYAVSGKSLSEPTQNVMAFAFDFASTRPIATFAPATSGTFSQPHDMAVSSTGDSVYVVEIGPNNIWRFIKSHSSDSADNLSPKELLPSTESPSVVVDDTQPSLVLRKATILDPNINSHQSNETKNNFSFDLLRIRTKEFREKIWSNELFYFILLGLFLFIIVLNMPCSGGGGGGGTPDSGSQSTIRFCLTILSLLKYKMDQSTHKGGKRRRRGSSERIRLSDVLGKSNKQSKIDRWQGFNRLPQDESEHDHLAQESDDDDDDDDDDDNDSVVLGDFTHNKKKHHLNGKSINSVNHVIS